MKHLLFLLLIGISVSGMAQEKKVKKYYAYPGQSLPSYLAMAFNSDYSCKKSNNQGSLKFWVIDDDIVIQECWRRNGKVVKETAYLCHVVFEEIQVNQWCNVEPGQWDGLIDEHGCAVWKNVEQFFKDAPPMIISYDKDKKTMIINNNIFKCIGKTKTPIDLSSVLDHPAIGAVSSGQTIPPSFLDGDWFHYYAWIYQHLRYPHEAKEKGIEGKVKVLVTIKKDGSIGDVTIKSTPSPLLKEEALRVVKSMPKWNPAIMNGETVDWGMEVHVDFKIY